MTRDSRLQPFECLRAGVTLSVQALGAESACKKAFRSPSGWHWEDCSLALAEVLVKGADGVSYGFKLVDNG